MYNRTSANPHGLFIKLLINETKILLCMDNLFAKIPVKKYEYRYYYTYIYEGKNKEYSCINCKIHFLFVIQTLLLYYNSM